MWWGYGGYVLLKGLTVRYRLVSVCVSHRLVGKGM